MTAPLSTRPWPASAPLATVLKAGAIVAGVEAKTSNSSGLPELLHARLEKFDETFEVSPSSRTSDLQSLQLDTAFASLYVLERVHDLLALHDAEHINDTSAPPLIGMKDMAQLRTSLSIVFNWGTELLFARILPSLPNKPTRSPRIPPDAHIIDLTATFEDITLLFDILNRLLTMILPDGPQGPSSTTFVAMSVLSRGFTELLRACICLAWLPGELRGDLPPEFNLDLKPYVLRLLNGTHPAQSITSLGLIMRKHGQRPWYMAKECTRLSTDQLMRPAGIAGLFSSVFGEELSSSEAPLEKLEMVSKLLTNVPPKIPREIYYPMMIPRLLHLLSPSMDQKTPSSHKRAAAFGLSRMLLSQQTDKRESAPDIRVNVINWCLLDSFNPTSQNNAKPTAGTATSSSIGTSESAINPVEKARSIATNALVLTPSSGIPTLSTILLNTDPSPALIGILLQPIASRLYTLLEYLRETRTADPTLRETTEGLLGIWARAAGKDEVVDALWEVVEGRAGAWGLDETGELRVTERSLTLPSLTLSQFADLQEGKLETEENEESNPLNLNPHPLHFAQFLKSINRNDVSSALYLRILDAHFQLDNEEDPLRKLILFKLSMQISAQVGSDAAADSPLKRPDVTRMLMFIKMSLAQDEALRVSKGEREGKMSLESLRLVPEEDEAGEDGDSDDEDLAPGLEGVSKSEHLSVTAVNLLLALLEEHADLSPRTVPLLNDIYTQLEPLANSASEALRPRAREARITLTARIASTDALPRKESISELGQESSQEKYQRALKLLQDPLLPVRGHGLLLLRELVAPAKNISGLKKGKESGSGNATGAIVSTVQGAEVAAAPLDAALMPAILSIFMQSIQDEDSYIFLNSVQGLAAMVDGYGRDVLRGLVDEYAKGLEGMGGSSATMTTRELDKRVRVGEALGQIIKRCGSTLVNYVDLMVPRVFAVVRASHLPTTLRTSAVSLLATAADTSAISLVAYTADLVSAMVDLVQIESVRAKPRPRPTAAAVARPVPDSSKITEGRANGEADDVTFSAEASPWHKERNARGTESGDSTNQAGKEVDTMDNRPTAANSKFPPLRRAAFHFMSLLVRALTERAYSGDGVGGVPPGNEMKRALSVLRYVAVTDEDEVVRVMAREASENVEQLQRALLGL